MKFRYSIVLAVLLIFFLVKMGAETQDYNTTIEQIKDEQRMPVSEMYPYRSIEFRRFVSESMRVGKSGTAEDFYAWMEETYRNSSVRITDETVPLETALDLKKKELNLIDDPEQKASAEIETCAKVHKMLKKVIPKFSLDRGFEFFNLTKQGERQCFSQSVIIAGLLQSMGMDAGVAMVYKNQQNKETNNGHAVTLVKLSNGRDILVDASEASPFAHHRGLFIKCPDYHYADPVYKKDSPEIIYYRQAGGDRKLSADLVRPLDGKFIESQFWYYRGERVENALPYPKKTAEGLARAHSFFSTSYMLCPRNPLNVYMLGRVYLAEGNTSQARRYVRAAYRLYAEFGWIPQGVREYLKIVSEPPTQP